MLSLILILIFKILGGKNMVDLYVCLIVNGRRTFVQVPAKFQPAVHADLLAMGLDDNGNPIVTTVTQ
jgi:hypothetical protein